MNELVSCIIPVYNASTYLKQCLESLLHQSYESLQIICVNDGSTDNSDSILKDLQATDNRVIVIQQTNQGAASARNTGLDCAKGEYVFMMDADDFCEPSLIEKAVNNATLYNSDMVLLPFYSFDERIQYPVAPGWDNARSRYPQDPFSWKDNPDYIFQSTLNYPWNKLFRRSFIEKHGLRFQRLHLTEDLTFCGPASVLAERISLLDERLIFHREGLPGTLMGEKDNWPDDFFKAFLYLRSFLLDQHILNRDGVLASFVSWALDSCQYNLETLNDADVFHSLFQFLSEQGFSQLGIDDDSAKLANELHFFEFYKRVKYGTEEQFLHCEFRSRMRECERLYSETAMLRDDLSSSRSQIKAHKEQCDMLRHSLDQC